jgi:alkylation response protein AidB-like acyl-CoA dehydrogenase
MKIVERCIGAETPDDDDLLEAVRDSVRTFGRSLPSANSPGAGEEKWRRVADSGWLGLLAAEDHGGTAMSPLVMAALFEELGKVGVGENYAAVSVLSLVAIDQCEPGPLRDRLLCGLASGEARPLLCWEARAAGMQREDAVQWATVRAERDQLRIRGRWGLVDFVESATHFCFPADHEGRVGLVVVSSDDSGLQVSTGPALSGPTIGAVAYDGLVAANSFMPLADAASLEPAFSLARLAAAAQLSGLARRIIELTVEYTSQRVQFARPIGSNQVVQHRLVDMWMDQTLAAAAVAKAARACSSGPQQARLESFAAKARAGGAADAALRGGFQLHGAIGYTEEYALGDLARACLALTAWLGSPLDLRRRFVCLERAMEGAEN